jgi:hypothetical protein
MVSSDNIVRPLAWFVAVESAISAIIAPIAVRLVERVRELKAELEPFRRTLKLLSADTAAADASDVLAYQRGRKPLGEVVSSTPTRATAFRKLEGRQIDVAHRS